MTYGIINADKMTTSDGVSSAGLYGFKNRIINGDMRIDQRNAGASIATPNGYTVDRFRVNQTTTGKLTAQQNQGSVTPPAGFSNYLGVTSSSAYSVASGDAYWIDQAIEGFNFADMAWGTASAATITLSFRVYSSLTGTFGGSLRNSATNRSYPFTYTIASANTWTTISITIAGDTTGTWVGATNGVGVYVSWGLGVGSTFSGTAGTWAGANYLSATGATSVVGTNGATFYITGVQLEKGSTATSFDYLDYGRSLIQCQRYYYDSRSATQIPNFTGTAAATNNIATNAKFPVTMRASPTIILYSYNNTANKVSQFAAAADVGTTVTVGTFNISKDTFINAADSGTGFTTGFSYWFAATASAEL